MFFMNIGKSQDYTPISLFVLEDDDLSLQAKGLHCVLYSNNKNKISKIKQSTREVINELIQKKYVVPVLDTTIIITTYLFVLPKKFDPDKQFLREMKERGYKILSQKESETIDLLDAVVITQDL